MAISYRLEGGFGSGETNALVSAGLTPLPRVPVSLTTILGDDLFVVGGVAYTPLDDAARGRLLSVQLGYSHEEYARNRVGGAEIALSGGRMDVVHPTLVGGLAHHWLAFAVVSLPVSTAMRDEAQRDRWRAGFGVVYLSGGHP